MSKDNDQKKNRIKLASPMILMWLNFPFLYWAINEGSYYGVLAGLAVLLFACGYVLVLE